MKSAAATAESAKSRKVCKVLKIRVNALHGTHDERTETVGMWHFDAFGPTVTYWPKNPDVSPKFKCDSLRRGRVWKGHGFMRMQLSHIRVTVQSCIYVVPFVYIYILYSIYYDHTSPYTTYIASKQCPMQWSIHLRQRGSTNCSLLTGSYLSA